MSIRRKLGCLLCACLLAGACAGARAGDTVVYETKDASAVWQSNSGKMQIYLLDTRMYRPQAEQLYLTDVTPRLFNKDEILRVLRLFQPEAESVRAEYKEIYKNRMLLDIKNDQFRLLAAGTWDNGTWSEAGVKCTWNNNQYITGGMQILQRIHGGNAKHCRYTQEEARALADAAAAAIAPDYAYSAWGFMELYPKDGSDTNNDQYDYIEGYSFCYTPVIDGVQVPYTPAEDTSDGLTLLPVRLPRLYVKIMDSGLYEIVWEGAQDVGAKTPVSAILPDAQIMEIAQSILPLAHMEVEKWLGNDAALVVERIQLSYCRVQRRDKPGQYVMTPVWDFFGEQVWDNEDGTLDLHRINPNAVLLTLNAIDGTVIDRRYGY